MPWKLVLKTPKMGLIFLLFCLQSAISDPPDRARVLKFWLRTLQTYYNHVIWSLINSGDMPFFEISRIPNHCALYSNVILDRRPWSTVGSDIQFKLRPQFFQVRTTRLCGGRGQTKVTRMTFFGTPTSTKCRRPRSPFPTVSGSSEEGRGRAKSALSRRRRQTLRPCSTRPTILLPERG